MSLVTGGDQISELEQKLESMLREETKNITNVIEKQQDTIDKQQTLLEKQQNTIEKLQEQLNLLIPLGFLYSQLPNQPTPQELWPNMKWTEVSAQYSGVFFRVVGEESAQFGQIQGDNSPRPSQVYSEFYEDHLKGAEKRHFKENVSITKGEWSGWLWTGDYTTGGKDIDTKFYLSDGEVRPRNMAIRIWKRSG